MLLQNSIGRLQKENISTIHSYIVDVELYALKLHVYRRISLTVVEDKAFVHLIKSKYNFQMDTNATAMRCSCSWEFKKLYFSVEAHLVYLKVIIVHHFPNFLSDLRCEVVEGHRGDAVGGQQRCPVLHQLPSSPPKVQESGERTSSFRRVKIPKTNQNGYNIILILRTMI